MKSKAKEIRRNEIMDIATKVLNEHGYRNASMLKVAKAANASKETLYSWFGDKRGMFESIIRRNASEVQAVLENNLDGHAPVEQALKEFGEALLRLLTSENSIALNRAAISELRSDPELAETLINAGRNTTMPLFLIFLEYQRGKGVLRYESSAQAASDFLGLLIGDLNIRRLLGALDEPCDETIEEHVQHASDAFLRLYSSVNRD